MCDSSLWIWLPPGWIGRCTPGLVFTHGFIIAEKTLLICHTLKTHWERLYFTGMIIWLQYSSPLWELRILCYKLMLLLTLLNDFTRFSKKLFQSLMLKSANWKVVLQSRFSLDILTAAGEELVPLFITKCCTYVQIGALTLFTLLNIWTRWFRLWMLLTSITLQFWKALTSSPWWKTILVIIIILILFCFLYSVSVTV